MGGAADTKGFSVIGGGDSVAAVNLFGVSNRIGYICTGSGALVRFLSGKELPVVKALKLAKKIGTASSSHLSWMRVSRDLVCYIFLIFKLSDQLKLFSYKVPGKARGGVRVYMGMFPHTTDFVTSIPSGYWEA